MARVIATLATCLVLCACSREKTAVVPAVWEDLGDVSVVKSEDGQLTKIRFDNEYISVGSESGCYDHGTHDVEVVSQQFDGIREPDRLFRGRGKDGKVESYRIPLYDAPQVLAGWNSSLISEGSRVRVTAVICGMGGYVYATLVERI